MGYAHVLFFVYIHVQASLTCMYTKKSDSIESLFYSLWEQQDSNL